MASQVAATPVPEPTDKFVTLNGIKLHYADWGGDPSQGATVLIHGGSANLHWWDLTAPLLTGEGRVLALDFRGHGHSQWASAADYGPAGYIEDVKAFIKHLGVRVVLVGHSMGGAVVLWIAALHPELLEALIIVDSRGGPPPFWRKWQWQWQQRAKPRPRPELASADDIIRRFRLHPEGTYLTREGLAELESRAPCNCPMGAGPFVSIRRPANGASAPACRCPACVRSKRRRWSCAARKARCSARAAPDGCIAKSRVRY